MKASFFFRHCNSSLCYAVIKILLFNELSCKMKLIIKKTFMIAFLSTMLIIFFFYSSHCCKHCLEQEIINTGVEIHVSQCTCIPTLSRKIQKNNVYWPIPATGCRWNGFLLSCRETAWSGTAGAGKPSPGAVNSVNLGRVFNTWDFCFHSSRCCSFGRVGGGCEQHPGQSLLVWDTKGQSSWALKRLQGYTFLYNIFLYKWINY